MTDAGRLCDYYDVFDEWARLDTPAGQLEHHRTVSLLVRYLRPESRILALGCGPGRYAMELARRGHRLCLADVSARQLALARARIADAGLSSRVESVDQANAAAPLPYPDAAFDAVLAMGPFYHLLAEQQRHRAACEIARVLVDDGLAFVVFIPRLSGLAGLIERASADGDQVSRDAFAELLHSGVFRNRVARGFQEGYYAEPGEIERLFESVGFAAEQTVSLRGIAFGREAALPQIRLRNPPLCGEIVRALDRTASDPHVIATSGHAMHVARRRCQEPS